MEQFSLEVLIGSVAAVVGAIVSIALTIPLTLWIARRERQQEVMDEVDDCLRTIKAMHGPALKALEAERVYNEKRKKDDPPFEEPKGWDGEDARNVPAELEWVGIKLLSGVAVPPGAFKNLKPLVLLCDDSTLLWQDESSPKDPVYWEWFTKLAGETRKH